jgi:hypothetical protein
MDGEQCNGRPFFNGRGQVREMKAQDLGAPQPSPRRSASAERVSIEYWMERDLDRSLLGLI